jgi:hypothetical protein
LLAFFVSAAGGHALESASTVALGAISKHALKRGDDHKARAAMVDANPSKGPSGTKPDIRD